MFGLFKAKIEQKQLLKVNCKLSLEDIEPDSIFNVEKIQFILNNYYKVYDSEGNQKTEILIELLKETYGIKYQRRDVSRTISQIRINCTKCLTNTFKYTKYDNKILHFSESEKYEDFIKWCDKNDIPEFYQYKYKNKYDIELSNRKIEHFEIFRNINEILNDFDISNEDKNKLFYIHDIYFNKLKY